jgi:hypothetical protein
MRCSVRIITKAAVIAALLLLLGCSGGGDGNSPTPQDSPANSGPATPSPTDSPAAPTLAPLLSDDIIGDPLLPILACEALSSADMAPALYVQHGDCSLTTVTLDWSSALPTWSPDGGSIALTLGGPLLGFPDDANTEIGLVRPPDAAVELLTNSPGLYEIGPVWSADSSTLAYVTVPLDSAEGSLQVRGLGPAATLTTFGPVCSDSSFALSPDGDLIAYNDGCGDPTLYVADVSDRSVTQIAGDAAGFVTWAPGSDVIAYSCHAADDVMALCLVTPDGSGAHAISFAEFDGPAEVRDIPVPVHYDIDPLWLGDRLTFTGNPGGGLYVYDTGGSGENSYNSDYLLGYPHAWLADDLLFSNWRCLQAGVVPCPASQQTVVSISTGERQLLATVTCGHYWEIAAGGTAFALVVPNQPVCPP